MQTNNTVAGRYRLLEKIGSGGMSEVWLAEDTRLNRQVALKVLLDTLLDNSNLYTRFVREGEITARLNHPNVIPIYDQGILEDGRPYIVMEHISGQTLSAKETSGLSIEEILEIFSQILDALQAAHKAGIIHRDLKPDNVLVEDDLRVRLLDFGVAKDIKSPGTDTEAGTIIGTARYLSPEQAHGEEAGEQSDLYAVGIMLYEALTNRSPWESTNTIASLVQQSTEPASPPSEINAAIPPYLDETVLRAIAYRQDFRFQSAKEFQGALWDKPETTNKKWRWAFLFLPLVIILAGWWYLQDFRTVPQLEGKTLLEARQTLYKEGLKWFSRQSPSSRPRGEIILTSPDSGTRVRESDVVVLFISSGPPPVEVPNVIGLSEEDALNLLREAGLEGDVASGSGDVLSSTPSAGEDVKRGTEVSLELSSSNPKTPSLISCINLTETDCQEANPSILLETQTVSSDEPAGIVVRETLRSPKTLIIFISSGPQEIIVPNLIGLSLENAKSVLRDYSLGSIVQYRQTDGEGGIVLKQSPKAERPLRPGDEVLLIVSASQ